MSQRVCSYSNKPCLSVSRRQLKSCQEVSIDPSDKGKVGLQSERMDRQESSIMDDGIEESRPISTPSVAIFSTAPSIVSTTPTTATTQAHTASEKKLCKSCNCNDSNSEAKSTEVS